MHVTSGLADEVRDLRGPKAIEPMDDKSSTVAFALLSKESNPVWPSVTSAFTAFPVFSALLRSLESVGSASQFDLLRSS